MQKERKKMCPQQANEEANGEMKDDGGSKQHGGVCVGKGGVFA